MNIRQKTAYKLLEKKVNEAYSDLGNTLVHLDIWHNHAADSMGFTPYAHDKPVKVHLNDRQYFCGIVCGLQTSKGNYAVIRAGLSYIRPNRYWDATAVTTWATGKYGYGANADRYLADYRPVTEADKRIYDFLQMCEKHHLEAVSNLPDVYPDKPENIGRPLTDKELKEWKPPFSTRTDYAKNRFIEKLSLACGIWTDKGFNSDKVAAMLNTDATMTNMLRLAMSNKPDKLPAEILELDAVKAAQEKFVNEYIQEVDYIKATVLDMPETHIFTL